MQRMITLTLKVEREDDQYVSTCPELDLSSYGNTTDEAFERLENMILLYLDTIEADGERGRIFAPSTPVPCLRRLDGDLPPQHRPR